MPPDRTPGITALAAFFLFGTLMSGLAALLLLFPATPLDQLWRLNPRGHQGFLAMGFWAVILMLLVCAACATAAVGLLRRKRWGYWTAIAVLSINLAGDTANIAHDWRTVIGLPIGGAMLLYLISRRRSFDT